jgi:hypothetical protein
MFALKTKPLLVRRPKKKGLSYSTGQNIDSRCTAFLSIASGLIGPARIRIHDAVTHSY